jgi:hypothetical protein
LLGGTLEESEKDDESGDGQAHQKERTYEEMNAEEKINYLDELVKQRPVPEIYKKHILEDEKEEVCIPPKKNIKKIMNYIKKEEWEDLSISLLDAFNSGNKHWAMKIYYENEINK